MLSLDELDQIRGIVREELTQVEKRLVSTITQQGSLLLDAIEINGQESIKTDRRVDRIEEHLNLPPVKYK